MNSELVRGDDALELLDTAVIRLDAQGRVVDLNAAATQCLGVGRDRARGQALGTAIDLPQELRLAIEFIPGETRGRHLQELQMPGGTYDCRIQATADGSMLLELHDLRWEHHRSRLQQREIQSGLMELLSQNLGHEIRNPLGGIRGAAQMLANELESDLDLPDLTRLARMIMRESDRIEELIARFGQPSLAKEPSEIYPLLSEVTDLILAEYGDTITIQRDFDPSIPRINCDPAAVRQILLNLVRNGCQAQSQSITLRTRIAHDPALLQSAQPVLSVQVIDDGMGVPPKLRPLLFLPLVTSRRDGTGLGLALAQQMAAAHDGLLSYQPRQEMDGSEGSCFTLLLPIRSDIHE